MLQCQFEQNKGKLPAGGQQQPKPQRLLGMKPAYGAANQRQQGTFQRQQQGGQPQYLPGMTEQQA